MPHVVKLTKQDQILLLNLLADSYEYKAERKLRSEQAITKMGDYYINAAEKIRDNLIEVNSIKSNLFTWMTDQLKHSGTKIWHSPECQEALEVCAAASQGHYERYTLRRSAQRFIEEK